MTISIRRQMYRAWCAALVSGKYPQAENALRANITPDNTRATYGYCCLGVACDLDLKVRNERWRNGDEYTTPKVTGLEEDNDKLLTPWLRSQLGITRREQGVLTTMNDHEGADFRQIAVYIEQRLMPKAMKRPFPYKERTR